MPIGPLFFRRQIFSRPADIAQLAEAMADWAASCGIGARTANYVNLMLDELVANIAEHAYGGRDDGPIDVSAQYDGMMVRLTLRDEGPPFDPTRVAPAETSQNVDERKLGGLGVHFVHQIADSFSYRRIAGSNEIVVCKADDSNGEKELSHDRS